MRSKTAEKILSETTQETKDKVRDITDRQIQLLQLGLEPNEHQRVFDLYKYGVGWAIDFHEITDYDDSKWNILIDDLIYDLQEVKKRFYADLKESDAYLFRAKEDKKQILDLLNKYRSWLAEETRCKMGRTLNIGRTIQLKSKIEVLKELYDSKRNK